MSRLLFFAALITTGLLSATPLPASLRQPLVFEHNLGQAPSQASWIAHGPGYQVQITSDAAVIVFREHSAGVTRTLKMKLAGSRPWSQLTGLNPTGGVSNYLHPRSGAPSLTGIPHYSRLQVPNVYSGIDLVFYNNNGNLEYDFIVQPGANPQQIQLVFEGQRGMHLDNPSGDLVLTTPSGSEIRQKRPAIYQETGDHRVDVAGGYKLLPDGRAAFVVANNDIGRALVIDPTLDVVSLISGDAQGQAVATDSEGNAYLTGAAWDHFTVTNGSKYDDGQNHQSGWDITWEIISSILNPLNWNPLDWPTGFQGTTRGSNAFITKLSPQGAVLFSTYSDIGTGQSIAVDSTGVVITGWRTDTDASNTIKFGTGWFVQKLSPTGNYIYHTYPRDTTNAPTGDGMSIALDSQHNAWIAAVTQLDATGIHPKADSDALVVELNPQGGVIFRKTFGGSGEDLAAGVAVDRDDNPWFTGQTCSTDFPASPGFNSLKGKCGIFVLKLVHQGGTLATQFVTVFGGGESDAGTSIAVNANREAYVTGSTKSQIFPTSTGSYQPYPASNFAQGFITQIDGFGHFMHSTLLGSAGDTAFQSIALNAAGGVYVGGGTKASALPQNVPLVADPTAGIVAKLSPDLSTLYYVRQEGQQVNSVAAFEAVPAVTPTRLYSAGLANYNGNPRAFMDELADDSQVTLLRNYWITDRYINIQSGSPQAGQISPGWWSAQWEFILQPPIFGAPADSKAFWIRNRWQPDEYLNIQSGDLQSTPIGQYWLSARWTLEPINGTNLYRIRNVWQPDKCLNIESGSLTASHVEADWWSAWWFFDRVF